MAALAVIGGAVFWVLTAPDRLPAATLAALPAGDVARGEAVFWAGGCASCHAAPGSADGDRLKLVGGVKLATDFGTFVAPNVSQHPQDGIGSWSRDDFVNAVMRGVSPQGAHYYPAFPFASYARMQPGDVADLYAYMKTLPAVAGKAAPNEISFPFNVRRGLGLWKQLFLSPEPVLALASATPEVKRGQYLVEGPGHCGECHTPRNIIGGTDKSKWLAGAPAADGPGTIPNITPGGDLASWSAEDIANYLETGFTPEFDSAGGQMADVVKNMANLPASDRAAIAAYLKAIPSHGS